MSKIYFSAATSGFYPEELKENYEEGTGWPDDAVEITFAEWRQFAGDCPAGKRLGADEQGYPVWDDVPPPTDEELTAAALEKAKLLRAEADAVIAPLKDAFDGGYIDELDKSTLTAWQKYRYNLLKVDLNDPEWPAKPE